VDGVETLDMTMDKWSDRDGCQGSSSSVLYRRSEL